jgi:hypothetical protein
MLFKKQEKERYIMSEIFEVVSPVAIPTSTDKQVAPSLPDLNGKVVGELWNWAFRGNETFPMIEEELKATCEHLDDELGRIYTGDWTLDESGNLYKGGHIVTGRDDILDGIKSKTGIEYTLFFGKTRMLTTLVKAGTSERMNGTQAGDAVYATVVTQGQDFYAPDLVINGQPYSAYYTPLVQPDGTRVGMVFAGRASSGVTAAIRRIILHELLHVGIDVGNDGEEKYSVKPHDFEDFRLLVERWGVDWAEVGGEPLFEADIEEWKEVRKG